ncbi:MAG: hypothetical protein NVS4B5_13960 [Vulcanimicrobiaceae bacterium]
MIIVAFAVRLAIVVWSIGGAFIAPQVSLSERYFQEGYAIAAGWGYSTDEEPIGALTPQQQRIERGETTASVPRPSKFYGETLHPPGMSLLVAALHLTFGGNASVPMMVLGALLDTLAAAILYLMLRPIWSERVAFVTALTYALFLPQAYAATADRLPNGLESFFVISGFACVLRAIRTDGRTTYLWFAFAGFVIGLGGYMRPDYDLIAVGLFPFVWWYTKRFRRSALGASIMLAVTIATLFPWAYRNHAQFGTWTFTSSAVGSTLLEGLGEFSNPWGVGYSDEWLAREAKARGFKSAWTMEADRYFYDVFVRDIRQHPTAYAATIVKRIPLTLAPAHLFGFVNPRKTMTFTAQRRFGIDRYEAILRNPLYILAAYWDALLFAGISLIFLLCSLHTLATRRERTALTALLMAPHVYGIATHLLSDAEPRYILPSTFSIMIGFACYVEFRCVKVGERARVASTLVRS